MLKNSLIFISVLLFSCSASTESETQIGKMICEYQNGVSDEAPIIWKNGSANIQFNGVVKGLKCTIKF